MPMQFFKETADKQASQTTEQCAASSILPTGYYVTAALMTIVSLSGRK